MFRLSRFDRITVFLLQTQTAASPHTPAYVRVDQRIVQNSRRPNTNESHNQHLGIAAAMTVTKFWAED